MESKRVAIVGAGIWGNTHASIYNEHPYVELAGVCDRDRDKAMGLAQKFGIPSEHVYTDHRELLEKCDFDVAAVVTPDFLHRDICVDCANAKKDIIAEKPMATTRQDVIDIMESVKRNHVRIMVDLHNRFSPPFARTKQAIDEGELGTPYHAYFRLNDIKYVATQMLPWAAKSSILWFLGSHSVDTLRWIIGSEVKRVYCVSRRGILESMGVDTEDVYMTTLEFENGAIAQMENGWITPDTHPCINDIKFNIMGTKGMISLDLSNNQTIERFTEDKCDHPDVLVKHFVHGSASGFSYQSIRYFIDRIIDGKECIISAEDAANTSLVILAIMESAKARKPVEVQYL
jgi:predicted dehydrogenase